MHPNRSQPLLPIARRLWRSRTKIRLPVAAVQAARRSDREKKHGQHDRLGVLPPNTETKTHLQLHHVWVGDKRQRRPAGGMKRECPPQPRITTFPFTLVLVTVATADAAVAAATFVTRFERVGLVLRLRLHVCGRWQERQQRRVCGRCGRQVGGKGFVQRAHL